MIQELCDKIVSKNPFMLKHCFDRYKTQEMCDKAVDNFLLALKLVPDWYVTSNIIEKLDNSVFSNDEIVFGDLDSDFVTLFGNDRELSSITLDNINLDDDHFCDCDPETINHFRLMYDLV